MKVKQIAILLLIMCVILTGCMGAAKQRRKFHAFIQPGCYGNCRDEEHFREPSARGFTDCVRSEAEV